MPRVALPNVPRFRRRSLPRLRRRLISQVTCNWTRYPVTSLVTALLVLFLVLFPKGGVKVGPIPLTWGYLLLGFTLPPLILVRFIGAPLCFRRSTLAAFATVLPFNLILYYAYGVYGYDSLGITMSDIASFGLLPFAFLLIYPVFLPRIDGERLSRLLRFSILGAAMFGILLFILYPITGQLIEIPYLTVNADDYGLIEATKHISRGAYLKLISTYNNGNLYGVSTLMLMPLYDHLEKKAWRRYVLKLALILTLSRTIWFGLIADQLLSLLRIFFDNAPSFPRLAVRAIARQSVFLVVTAVAIIAGLTLTFGQVSFLFDQQLGGRSGTLVAAFDHINWLPSIPVTAFLEIVYASALINYGVLGLLSIILIFAFPTILFFANRQAITRDPLRMAAFKGLVLYALLAGVDGAINLIPVMCFYWFIYMIFLEGWPAALELPTSPARMRSDTIKAPVFGVETV